MKPRMMTTDSVSVFAAMLCAALLPAVAVLAQPQDVGSAFTYQGQLRKDGLRVNDTCDLEFSVWDMDSGGLMVAPPVPVPDLELVNGLFTAALDFGPDAFNGQARWLEVAARCGVETNFTVLEPRQELTPAPYSLYATKPWVRDPATGALSYTLGNVGIGTTNPGQKLSVSGTIESTSGGFKFPNASVQTTAAFGDITGVIAGTGLAPGGPSGDVTLGIIPDGVTSTELAADSVNSSEIAADAVGSSEIAASAVGSSELAADSVNSSEIAADAVGSSEIAASAVGSSEIANNSVGSVDLASDEASLNKVSGGWMNAATEGSYNRITVDPGPGTNRGALRVEAMDAQLMLTLNSNCPTGSANPPNLAAVIAYNNCDGFASNFGGITFQRRVNDNNATFQATLVAINANEVNRGWMAIDPPAAGPGGNLTPFPFRVGYNSTNGNGAHCTIGGVWTNGSDRNSKQNFEEIDRQEILRKVADLPVMRWQYKGEPDPVRHIGPVAQDFYAAFATGADDRFIGTLDAEGVALAAIQGLYEITREKVCEIEELQKQKEELARQNRELDARLAALEAIVHELNDSRKAGTR